MDFAFRFLLDVARLTGPAGESAEALTKFERALDKSARTLEKLERTATSSGGKVQAAASKIADKLDRLDRPAKTQAAQTNLRKIADEWEKLADKAAKAEAKQTAAAERESQKRIRLAEREAKARARAEEKAYRESDRGRLLGGHRSFGALLRDRAIDKGAGLVSRGADMILGAPAAIGGAILSGIGSAAGAAWDIARAGAEGAYSFGQMAISAQALREQSVEGFKAVYGSAETANRLTDQAIRIAKLTKFDTKDVVETYNTLAAGGFKENELKDRFGGYADVSSARGSGYGRRYLTGIQKLNAQPSALFATFQQAAMAGPGLKLAEEVLAKQLGVKGGNIDAQLRKMFREKKISGSQALAGVEGAVSQRYDQGGALGSFAEQVGSGTWEGLISNIKNGLGDVLAMKMPADHPMMRFKALLADIGGKGGLFDEQSKSGQRFQELMKKLMEDVFLIFDIDKSSSGTMLDKLLSVAERLEEKFHGLSVWIHDKILPTLTEGLKGDLTPMFIDLGEQVGGAIVRGMWNAATSGGNGRVNAKGERLNSEGTTSLITGGNAWRELFGMAPKLAAAEEPPKFTRTDTGSAWGDLGVRAAEMADFGNGGGASRGGRIQVEGYAEGGTVPGRYGEPRLVIAHGGETFHGLRNVPSTSGMGGGGGGASVTLTGPVYIQLDGAGKGGEQLVDEIFAALMQRIGQNTRGPSAGSLPGAA